VELGVAVGDLFDGYNDFHDKRALFILTGSVIDRIGCRQTACR